MSEEEVNSPKHYKVRNKEAIEIIEAYNLNFRLGNAMKYILRSGLKGEYVTDLRKAMWYLRREIAKHENSA